MKLSCNFIEENKTGFKRLDKIQQEDKHRQQEPLWWKISPPLPAIWRNCPFTGLNNGEQTNRARLTRHKRSPLLALCINILAKNRQTGNVFENKLARNFISRNFVPKIGYCQHLILYLVMSTFNSVTNKRSRANKLSTLSDLCCRGAFYAVAEDSKNSVAEQYKNTNTLCALCCTEESKTQTFTKQRAWVEM